jgi:DNA primase
MAIPRIHPDTIEAVKQQVNIVDVVSDHVVLKKQGKDFVGLCPFHDDKSPSFSVSPSKQFYYCFSCGAGGNAFKFLMELGKTSFAEVALDLAQRYQVPVQTLEPAQRQELQRQLSLREQLYEILAVATRFYEHALHQPQGQEALAYLQDQRQLKPEIIQQFQLGYAPAGWSTLYGYLVEQKRYPVKLVEQAGLIVPRKGGSGYYDRFRARLMIPIQDVKGRVIGFGGRTLTGEDPKYLNSPETELFDKGKTLFGLDKARGQIAKDDRAILVEGYFDVIALHGAGVTNTVAALGTALGVNQIKQLLRYSESKQIILNFDADGAGQKAAQRTIAEVEDLAYQGQIQLRVMNLPGGKDADEYLKQYSGPDYRDLLDRAPLWIDWQIQQILQHQDLKQSDQFQLAVQGLVKLLGKLPNTTLRTHYIHHCAELLGQGESRVALRLEEDLRQQVKGQRWHGQSRKWEKPGDGTVRERAEGDLLRLYLHSPEVRSNLRATLSQRQVNFSIFAHRLLWRQICELEGDGVDREANRETSNRETHLGRDYWGTDLDLVTLVQERVTDFPAEAMARILPILQLTETGRIELSRPHLVIRGATATLERLRSEKRCRHLLDSWQLQAVQSIEECVEQLLQEGLGVNGDAENRIEQLYLQLNQTALDFQKRFYDEWYYLQDLSQERCTSTADLSQRA